MDNNKGRIKTKCKELTKYLDEHINIYVAKFRSFSDDDIDKRNLKASVLIWSLLKIMLENDGVLVGK